MTSIVPIPNGDFTAFSVEFTTPSNMNITIPSSDGELIIGSSGGDPVTTTLSASNGITITNGPGSIGLSFNQSNSSDPYTAVDFSMSPYTVLNTDYFISVDSTGGPVSIVFPNTLMNRGSWVVKDRLGNATINNITLSTTGGLTFDGSATLILSINFSSTQLFLFTSNFEVF